MANMTYIPICSHEANPIAFIDYFGKLSSVIAAAPH